jgi:hypothetical protein
VGVLAEVRETYLGLRAAPSEARREWLLARQPASPAQWWHALVDCAISDADPELVEFLVALAVEHGWPPRYAVQALVELAGQAGRPSADDIALLALNHFHMSRDHAVARAAELRANPDAMNDDYLRLLDISAMLNALAPLVGLMTGTVAVVVRAWLDVLSELP